MNASDRQKIQQTIALLQQVLGQKSGSGGIPKVTIPNFDQQVNNYVHIAQQLEPEIKQLTAILNQCIGIMQNIINYSAVCKAPTEAQKNSLQEKFKALSKRTQNVEKNQNFVYHARSIRELLSATFWVFTNTPEFIIKAGIQSADFNAIKFQKNKVQGHNDWWKSIGKALRILEDFVKRQYNLGLNFNNNGTHSWSQLTSGGSGQNQASTQPQQQTAQQNPVAQQKPQAPKVPKKQLQGPNWAISNMTNEKVSFNPGQIQMKHGIFIQNCHDTIINIDDKFKSLQMNKCSKIVLVVNHCVSGVEIMNSESIQIHVKGQVPSISVDKCQKVKVMINQAFLNCDILTSKTSEINIFYQKNNNESKPYMVAEQLITKWNNDKKKFQTVIYDKFL